MKKLLFYGVHILILSFIVLLVSISRSDSLVPGILFFSLAIILACLNLVFSLIYHKERRLKFEPLEDAKINVGITAYNDELSIGTVVKEFREVSGIGRTIVIDNNSTDSTAQTAAESGAEVIKEEVQGYGASCIRALKEARKGADLTVLVEGDGTFSANDLKKFLTYIENADLVIGTRTTRELCSPDSQMNFFMQYGNLFMAKLIQLIYWDTRLTDVGCTYRVIRKEALDKIIDQFKITGNHFSVEMILVALKNGLKVIEIPVTFKKRIGKSKGVGRSFRKGFINALKMWWLIVRN